MTSIYLIIFAIGSMEVGHITGRKVLLEINGIGVADRGPGKKMLRRRTEKG